MRTRYVLLRRRATPNRPVEPPSMEGGEPGMGRKSCSMPIDWGDLAAGQSLGMLADGVDLFESELANVVLA